jgi:HlyD family secretion protein
MSQRVMLGAGLVVAGLLAVSGRSAPPPATAARSAASAKPSPELGVGALGRLQPKDGVLVISGPSDFVAVVGRLYAREGEWVRAGQVIAATDTLPVREAALARAQAQVTALEAAVASRQADLENARFEYERSMKLAGDGILSAADRDASTNRFAVAKAALDEARAQLVSARADVTNAAAARDMAIVRAPVAGQVLKIHAYPGEKIGQDGILELARNDVMYAVAEVYESDISRIHVGQQASVESPVLPAPLKGKVERIARRVGRKTVQQDDPSAPRDLRVVEVHVRLDDSPAAAPFSGLLVSVRFKEAAR